MGLAKVHCGATPPSVMVLFNLVNKSHLFHIQCSDDYNIISFFFSSYHHCVSAKIEVFDSGPHLSKLCIGRQHLYHSKVWFRLALILKLYDEYYVGLLQLEKGMQILEREHENIFLMCVGFSFSFIVLYIFHTIVHMELKMNICPLVCGF